MNPRAYRGPAVAAVLLGAIFSVSLRPATDSDYFWHVAVGRQVERLEVNRADVFSWTAAGRTWVDGEWLSEGVMAVLHDALGPMANSVLAAALVTLAFGLVMGRLRRRAFGWTTTIVVAALGFAASLVSIGVRIQVLELVYLALTLVLVDRWLAGGRDRLLLGLVGLAWLWAQTHGSFLLLPAMLVAASAAAAVVDVRPAWRAVIAACASVVVAIANPFGWDLVAYATGSVSSPTVRSLIQEWRPPDFGSLAFWPFELEILLLVAALGALFVRGTGVGAAGTATVRTWLVLDALVAAGMLALALQSGRHVMLFGIAAAPLLAAALETLWPALNVLARTPVSGVWRKVAAPDAPAAALRRLDLAAAAVVVATVSAAGLYRVAPDRQAEAIAAAYPIAVVDSLRVALADRSPPRLFNDYAWGGFLILEAPQVPVFIDGRNQLYGDGQLERYVSIARLEPGWSGRLERLGIDLALIPIGSPLEEALASAGWRQLARDRLGALYERP